MIFVTLLAMSNSSYAYFPDGYEFVRGMKEHMKEESGSSNFDPGLATQYRAYVSGYTDALIFKGIICLTKEQNFYIVHWAVVDKHLKNNPEKWSEHPSILVADALPKSFSCK